MNTQEIIKKYKFWVIGAGALIMLLAGFYFAGKWSANKANKTIMNNYIALQDTVRNYQTKIKGLTVEVFETGRVVLSQADAIKSGLVEKEALKKLGIKTLSELTTLKMQISIVRDSVKHNGQVVYIDSSKHNPAILLPFTFGDTTKHYLFSGGFNVLGVMNYKFEIPKLSLDIYGGIDKKGVAKLSATTDFPYIKKIEISSVKIDVAKQRRIGFGAVVGYGVVFVKPIQLAPFAGFAGFYRIW